MDHGIYFDGKKIVEKRTNRTLAHRVVKREPQGGGRATWEDPFGGKFKGSDVRDFDESLAEYVEAELSSKKWSRGDLIKWLVWNDPNGNWTDKDAKAEGLDPMTKEDAILQVMDFVRENYETPQEMRILARR